MTTTTRIANQITNGHWIVRFAGTKRNTGTIARSGIAPTGDHFGDQPVYDAPITVNQTHNGTTLASAARILGIAGYDDVICFTAWEYNPLTGETTGDRFDWF